MWRREAAPRVLVGERTTRCSISPSSVLECAASHYERTMADMATKADDLANLDHLVILVHGINTYAYWMGQVGSALKARGFKVAETGYGRFSVLRFLLPFSFLRKEAIRRVVDQIRIAVDAYRPEKTSVITHSFGTYIIARILEDEPTIKWNRIIFCGSVVRYDFRLDRWKHKFLSPMINEVGTNDIYPALAESINSSYGSVGSHGFHHPLVMTRWHAGFR